MNVTRDFFPVLQQMSDNYIFFLTLCNLPMAFHPPSLKCLCCENYSIEVNKHKSKSVYCICCLSLIHSSCPINPFRLIEAPWAQTPEVAHPNCLTLYYFWYYSRSWSETEWSVLSLALILTIGITSPFFSPLGPSLSSQRESVIGQKPTACSLITMHWGIRPSWHK